MAKIRFAVGLILLLSLLSSSTPAIASPSLVKWLGVNIPTEGESGSWVLANGSDVQHLTMAIDGTVYCYANPSGTSYTLFKSTDGGYSWSYTGRVKDTIVDIAVAPDDASIVYYATVSHVYKSTDAGSRFTRLPPNPGGAGIDNLTITSIDVALLDNGYMVVAGLADADADDLGGVYTLDGEKLFSGWIDTNLVGYDVYAVAFSPNFPADWQLVAVVTDETHTYIINNYGVVGEWTGRVELKGANENSFATTAASDICFPSDFDETYELFVGVVGGDGGVYRVEPTYSYRLDVDADIISLDLVGGGGDIQLLAGENGAAEVWYSWDGGTNWERSTKPPTGQSKTCVLMAADFATCGKAYVATCGSESALSITQDGGVTYNQVGLIDTIIGIGNILDLAISPSYSQDDTLFMLTFDGEHSLWRSLSGGTKWERVFTSALANVASIKLVELSPRYGDESQVVYLAGTSNGNPTIWKSKDNGQAFRRRLASFPIDVWAVVNDDVLFIGSHDGSNGLVYRTTNGGLTYSTGAVAGNYQLYSIALSPNYEEDETILIGNTSGWVYWSSDDGTSFERIGQQLPQLIAEEEAINDMAVAFDLQFSTNHTVYAASYCHKDTKHSSAIYRFIIGTSTTWESIDSTLPEGSILSQLIVSVDGALYATNFKADGGMERCLNPTYPLGPTFETVTRGLDDGAALSGLWLCDNRLWSTDAKKTRLMTYTDSLTQPITLTSPSNNAPGMGTIINHTISNVSLDWEALSGATSYEWQLNYGTNFSTVPAEFEANTKATSAWLPSLEPATRYYWRVRATEPVLSPWSAKWSFTTGLGTESVALELYSPKAGARGVPLKPVFQWSAVAGADSYELLVATDISLASPLIIKIGAYALRSTAWQSDVSLDDDTTYYWKVRACSSESHSAWSAVGAFTTESPPSKLSSPSPPELSSPSPPELSSPSPSELSSPSPSGLSSPSPSELSSPSPSELSPPSPPPPASPQPTTIPDWTMWLVCLGGALLLTMVAMLITMVILTVRLWRF